MSRDVTIIDTRPYCADCGQNIEITSITPITAKCDCCRWTAAELMLPDWWCMTNQQAAVLGVER